MIWRPSYLLPMLSLLVACFPSASAAHEEGLAPEILFIASYHKGDNWTDRLIDAFEHRVRDYRIDLDIHYEYMDRRRVKSDRAEQAFRRFLRDKYDGMKLDLVVCSDDEALDFVVKHRNDLFNGVPVVFSGMSNLSRTDIGGNTGITGVAEAPDPRGTLRIALKLMPDTRHVAIINDLTAEGRVLRKMVENATASFPGVTFTFLENLSITDLLQRLQGLPQETVILQMAYDRKKEKTLSFSRYLQVLSKSVNFPVFSLWDHTVGNGVVGGRVVTSFGQGDEAARMTAKVLQGERPGRLPVVLQEASLYMFDDRQLRRFGISRRSVPDNSTIVAARTEKSLLDGNVLGGLAIPAAVTAAVLVGILRLRKWYKAWRGES